MTLVSFLSRLTCARRPGKSHGPQPLWKWMKNALWLEPLGNRSLPSTSAFTATFSGFTTTTDQPLAPSIPQFDTMGGKRTLESVEIISDIELDSSASGSVTNHSSSAGTEEATVTNASISVTGTGFTSPLTATQATLLDTGPVSCPGKVTTTIGPFSASLISSSDVTLTGGTLAPFIGTGNLSYTTTASADSTDHVTGGSNFAKNTTISANGTATVEIIYTYVSDPALMTTASQAVTLGTVAPTLTDSATLSGATQPTGTITFVLTGPGGFALTHTDPVNGNGTYTAGATLPTTGLVAGMYTWSAHYSGDANNNSANDQGGTAEQTVVTNASPNLVTTSSPNVTIGTTGATLSDSAVLSGGFFETGTITFSLTGRGGFSFTHTDAVHGNGIYTAGDTLPTTGLVAGRYTWLAHYSGDGNNKSAIDQGGTAEQTVVNIESDVGGPQLTIDKIGGETVHSGDTVHFTIVVSNQGPTTAQNVVLTDPLPDATHLAWTTDAGAIANGVLTDNIGGLSSGASVTIHVSAVTAAGYGATLNNTATATSTNNTPPSISASATDIVLLPDITPALSSISGSVFLDPAQQGNFVPPDVALPGVTITLTGVTSSGTSVITSVVTDINGNFTFTGLQPGTYNLVETQPVNFIPGASFPGDLGGTSNPDVISTITVGSSQTAVNYRFTQLSLTAQAMSKQQLLASSSGVEQLTGPAGTGTATVADPFAASSLAPGGHYFVTGAGFGQSPQVSVYNPTGRVVAQFYAYDPRFQGGVRVALGDVNGDGTPDIVTATGPTGSPDVRVFDGRTGVMVDEFMAYDPRFAGGVFAAVGDVNHDGLADIVTAPDTGGGPEVKVFSGKALTQDNTSLLADFMAYDPHFAGGVRVALGDVDHDGTLDLITGPGPGSGPDVRVFGGNNLATAGPNSDFIRELLAFAPTYSGGVNVAAVDTNADGFADIVVSPATTSSEVRIFSGSNLALLADFMAENHTEAAGLNVATVLGPTPAIITAGGTTSQVQVLNASSQTVLDSFFAAPSQVAGVYVGGI